MDYQVYSSDGLAPEVVRNNAYPERFSCLIWQPSTDGRGGKKRCLSADDKWLTQQLDPADLELLKMSYTERPDQQSLEDAVHRVSENSIPEPMVRLMAQLTQQRILQLEENICEGDPGDPGEPPCGENGSLHLQVAPVPGLKQEETSTEDTQSVQIMKVDEIEFEYGDLHQEIRESVYHNESFPGQKLQGASLLNVEGHRDITSNIALLVSNLTDTRPKGRPSLIEGYTIEENR